MSEETRPEQTVKTPEEIANAEKIRLFTLLLKEIPYLAEQYRALVKYTGSLLSASMVIAYARGLSDAAKLINTEKVK